MLCTIRNMSFQIKMPNGIEVIAGSVEEAAALLRQLQSPAPLQTPSPHIFSDYVSATPQQTPKKGGGRHTKARPQVTIPSWTPGVAQKFLAAIRDAGSAGTSASVLMKAVNVNHPKAIGGRTATINRLLKDLGFQPHHVYDAARTTNGRIWKPRRSLSEALTAIEKRMAA